MLEIMAFSNLENPLAQFSPNKYVQMMRGPVKKNTPASTPFPPPAMAKFETTFRSSLHYCQNISTQVT